MVAFMEMPMSAIARLNTRKLLGVLSSLTFRKATIVTEFRKMPSRPLGEAHTEQTENIKSCCLHHRIGPVRGARRAQRAQQQQRGRIPKHSPSTSRHDPRENTSSSENPSGNGYDVAILLTQAAAAVRLSAPLPVGCASV